MAKELSLGLAYLHDQGTVSQEIRYQAPESWQRRATLSEASDIYSFGVLLWTLMIGRLPHAYLRREDIMARIKVFIYFYN